MPKIKDVWVDAARCDKQTGMGITLTVYYDNNADITICLDSKADDPLFGALIKSKRCIEAQTDGECVYWPNGARLTSDEIVTMLMAEGMEGHI